MSRSTTLLFLTLIAASGCQSGPGPDACAGWKPIRPTPGDMLTMSQRLNDQVFDHDEYGQKYCGWTTQ